MSVPAPRSGYAGPVGSSRPGDTAPHRNARWVLLCDYTAGTIKFPKVGSTHERDRAVATVVAQLKKDHTRFKVLARER